MDDLQQEFILETRETLQALSSELVLWETAPGHGDHLDAIFRFFHTVKGSAGFLSLPRFERLAHEAENILASLRETQRPITSSLVSVILNLVDHIAELTAALENGLPLDDGDDSVLIEALHNAWQATLSDEAENAAKSSTMAVQNSEKASEDVSSHDPIEPQLRTIRVPLSLLDQMMNSVSDMVLARNEVARQLRELDDSSPVTGAFERLSACVGDLRNSIGRTRMQRMEGVFSPLPRIVRDLSRKLGKEVELHCEGKDVELDREMIEMIRDPLMHIVRNAIDHGIEMPEARLRAGKPVKGSMEIRASQAGNQVLITIVDDGAGIDTGALSEKAVAAQIYDRAQINTMGEDALLNLIFAPGISTANEVTATSGRGVGMDVVRANIERVGGTIDLHNERGKGLKMVIRAPLTLTIISCLIFQSGGHQFALPQSAVREITTATNAHVRIDRVGDVDFAVIRAEHLPVVTLDRLFGAVQAADSSLADKTFIVIDVHGGARFAMAVDSVTDHEDLVVRPGAPAIMMTNIFAGTTLPDNGRPMLLIDAAGVADKAGVVHTAQQIANAQSSGARDDEESASLERAVSLLVFRDVQARRRALSLDIIERVEDFAADRLAFSAGQLRVTKDDRTYLVFGIDRPPTQPQIKMLQLTDGVTTIFYAIDDIADIYRTTAQKLAAGAVQNMADESVNALIIIEDEQVEVVDGYWLFSQMSSFGQAVGPGAGPALGGKRPICLLRDDDDSWTRRMLEPLIVSAGYDVVYDAASTAADIVLVSDDQQEAVSANALASQYPDGKVIRLRSQPDAQPGANTIYRYDRIGLIGALQASHWQRTYGNNHNIAQKPGEVA